MPVFRETHDLFGTVCVLDPEPHTFSADDLDLLVIISGWLRLLIECNPLGKDKV